MGLLHRGQGGWGWWYLTDDMNSMGFDGWNTIRDIVSDQHFAWGSLIIHAKRIYVSTKFVIRKKKKKKKRKIKSKSTPTSPTKRSKCKIQRQCTPICSSEALMFALMFHPSAANKNQYAKVNKHCLSDYPLHPSSPRCFSNENLKSPLLKIHNLREWWQKQVSKGIH